MPRPTTPRRYRSGQPGHHVAASDSDPGSQPPTTLPAPALPPGRLTCPPPWGPVPRVPAARATRRAYPPPEADHLCRFRQKWRLYRRSSSPLQHDRVEVLRLLRRCGRIQTDTSGNWHTVAVPFSADARSAILRRVREHRVPLLCLLATGAFAACTTGQPARGDTSTPTLTTTYSPSSYSTAPASTPPVTTGPNIRPGEKPPTFPQSMEKDVPSAAGTFAVYWMKTIDWGYATVSSTLARTAFSPACTDCARFMKVFDDAHAKGVYF